MITIIKPKQTSTSEGISEVSNVGELPSEAEDGTMYLVNGDIRVARNFDTLWWLPKKLYDLPEISGYRINNHTTVSNLVSNGWTVNTVGGTITNNATGGILITGTNTTSISKAPPAQKRLVVLCRVTPVLGPGRARIMVFSSAAGRRIDAYAPNPTNLTTLRTDGSASNLTIPVPCTDGRIVMFCGLNSGDYSWITSIESYSKNGLNAPVDPFLFSTLEGNLGLNNVYVAAAYSGITASTVVNEYILLDATDLS